MSYTTQEGRNASQSRSRVGQTCNHCDERYFAIVVDHYGRARRDECGCPVEIVDVEAEIEEADRR